MVILYTIGGMIIDQSDCSGFVCFLNVLLVLMRHASY